MTAFGRPEVQTTTFQYDAEGHLRQVTDPAGKSSSQTYDALYNIGLVQGRAGHSAEARAALMRFVKTAPKERYAADIAAARQALTALP